MIHIGIDGGLSGGISVIRDKQIMNCITMPIIKGKGGSVYDIEQIVRFFKAILTNDDNILVILEKAHTMPLNGGRANFTNGLNYGIMQGILKSLRIPYEIIAARTWQKVVFQGQTVKDTKQSSILYCKNRFPEEDFRATERCRKDHDGKTDATCMAVYGSRL